MLNAKHIIANDETANETSAIEIVPGPYWHYKGKPYEVIGVARHSETEEVLVVYRALYGDYGLWVRPLEMFAGFVEVDGRSVRRFAPAPAPAPAPAREVSAPAPAPAPAPAREVSAPANHENTLTGHGSMDL